jgi:hypothetical protein
MSYGDVFHAVKTEDRLGTNQGPSIENLRNAIGVLSFSRSLEISCG